MKLTPDQLRQTAAAMLAFADGKPIQIEYSTGWVTVASPAWDMDYNYRPKPEPVTRPWSKPEDVPGPVCWVRAFKDAVVCDLIVTISDKGFIRSGSQIFTTWADTFRHEYSTDRKTWKLCTVTEP